MEAIELITADGVRLDGALHTAKTDDPKGAVLQAHGITVDMDEGGMFVRLAESLNEAGFDVLRFSYRGHGESGGAEESVTIAGEMIDFEAAFNHLRTELDGPYYVVAASFGAVSVCNLIEYIESDINGLVLWNPVLDLDKTFINPELEWGIENFTGEKINQLYERGYLKIDGEFRMGRVLYTELQVHDPFHRFLESSVPAMVIHGDSDSLVPYGVSKEVAKERNDCRFHTIEDSDHGFDSLEDRVPTVEKENEAIRLTKEWINNKN